MTDWKFLAIELMERVEGEIPAAACSCHIDPPCSDCVNYAGVRETIANIKAAQNE